MEKAIELKKLISRIASATFIGTVILALDSIVQAIYAGQILGTNGLVSIGSGFCIMLLFVAICEGFVAGTIGSVKDKYYANEHEALQESINVAWTVGIIVSVVLTVIGCIFSKSILELLGTDKNAFADAEIYLRINLAFSGLVYFIFTCLELLKNRQKRWLSLVYIGTTTVLNIIFIPLFATGIGCFPKSGIKSFAIVPLVTGTIGCILSIIVISKEAKGLFKIPTKLTLDFSMKEVILRGTQALMPKVQAGVSYLIILFFVNKYGANATSAFYVITRIDSLVTLPAIAVMTGVAAATFQVIASRKIENIKVIIKHGIKIMAPSVIFIALISLLIPNQFMYIFSHDYQIIKIGASYLRIASIGYVFFIFMYVSNGILYGLKKSVYTFYFSLIAIFFIRLPGIFFSYSKGYGIEVIWKIIIVSYIISTLLSIISNFRIQNKMKRR